MFTLRTHPFPLLLLASFAAFTFLAQAPPAAHAAQISVTEKGIRIESKGLGASVLEFPKLQPASGGAVLKPLAVTVNGNSATIKYESGEIGVEVPDGSRINFKFSNLPELKNYQLQMVVGFGQGPNRKWRIGSSEGEFPAQKPAKPHLYQGNATNFTLTNFENRSITFTIPEYSYQQLTDAREWGWSAFLWQITHPYNMDWKTASIQVADGTEAEVKKVVLVDKFGQSTQSQWPLKIKDEAEFKTDLEDEKAFFGSMKPPALDKYGGWPGSKAKYGFQATGFFHTEKKAGRWFLVNPEGNAFFHLGICAFSPSDDYTTVKGREHIYEWLPEFNGPLKSAFRQESGSGVLSFHLANWVRKYNEPYSPDAYVARMIERTRSVGFNSMGAFSSTTTNPAARAVNFPAVSSLPLDQWSAGIMPLPGMTNVWDPFDAKNKEKVDAAFAKRLPGRAQDPLLIGYFLTNEPLYEDIPKLVPGLKGSFACKQELVRQLREKYTAIEAFNTAWGAEATSWENLADTPLLVKTRQAAQDTQTFTGSLLEAYFVLVRDTFKKYDTNHLLIGNRLQSGTINNEQLCRLMGKYLDVISYNYYTYTFDKAFLNRLHQWTGDKPMMLTEFYWSSPSDSGMSSRQDVSNQRERGLAYRNYVEQAAALDYIVGIEWFTLVDQAVTGRWFSGFNGEAGNTGLFSVADRPWKPALEEMAKTNFAIYPIMAGEQKPFVFQDPRFVVSNAGKKTLPISRATGPIAVDGVATNWPGVPAEIVGASRLVLGSSAGGTEGAFKMCWDDANLYILADIKDKTPMLNSQPLRSLWNGDGSELFIGWEKVDEGGPLLFTDRQIILGGGKNGQVYFANSPEQASAETAVVPTVDGSGYTIEAAIPWKSLGIKPVDGMELALDLGVNDGEGKDRVRQLMWNGSVKNSGDRSKWGKAKLVR